MKVFRIFLFISTICLTATQLIAQLSVEGIPFSFKESNLNSSFQQISLPTPDIDSIISKTGDRNDKYINEPFASLIPLNLNPVNSGTWIRTKTGNQIWRLALSLEGSSATSLYFRDFKLPQGAELFIYDKDGEQIKGAFTAINNRSSGIFATELIGGGDVVLELNVPAYIEPRSWFTISEMTYSFGNIPDYSSNKGFGGSDYCEVNINCSPEGDMWQDQKRSAVRIQIKVEGVAFWCTGSLINNTRFNNTPYILTADHCAYKFGNYATAEDLESWLFYFNYESEDCDNPTVEPEHFSLTGCEYVANDGTAGSDGSDFYLIKLSDDIPASWNVYFAGWSVTGVPSESGVTIHHPDGDIKKISTYNELLTTTSWQSNGLDSHWKVYWTETENQWGVTEGGSSGAPIYDPQGRVVGTLTGGLASCANPDTPDYYGKMSYHWQSNGNADTNQLKPWLDPDNTGALVLNGSTMGEEEHYKKKLTEFLIYPNPADDKLFIEQDSPEFEKVEIQIIDLFGNLIKEYELTAFEFVKEINISFLEKGFYFVRLARENKVVIRKFVKN